MNKKLIYIVATIILVAIMIVCFTFFLNNRNNSYETEKIGSEKILDDCTDEYEYLKKQNLQQASTADEKVSPDCKIILRKMYNKCNHIIDEQVELPQEIVNMNKEQLEKEYVNWKVESFSPNEVILYKEVDGQCGQHYILRDNDGIIVIYQINENGEEELLDETEISTEYLTQTDLIEIQKGLKVNSLEELNKILEDYE